MSDTSLRPRCFTLPEAAEYLGVSVRTMYQWQQRRYGPKSFRVGKRRMYMQADVDAWLDAQRNAS